MIFMILYVLFLAQRSKNVSKKNVWKSCYWSRWSSQDTQNMNIQVDFSRRVVSRLSWKFMLETLELWKGYLIYFWTFLENFLILIGSSFFIVNFFIWMHRMNTSYYTFFSFFNNTTSIFYITKLTFDVVLLWKYKTFNLKNIAVENRLKITLKKIVQFFFSKVAQTSPF